MTAALSLYPEHMSGPLFVADPLEPTTWMLGTGTVIRNVHHEIACYGRACPIHDPSDHHMRSWPVVWRNDRGMIERTCECGIGHPDPDALMSEVDKVHGCCGHCVPPNDDEGMPGD